MAARRQVMTLRRSQFSRYLLFEVTVDSMKKKKSPSRGSLYEPFVQTLTFTVYL